MYESFASLRDKAAAKRANAYAILTLLRHLEICRRFNDRRHVMNLLLVNCEALLRKQTWTYSPH